MMPNPSLEVRLRVLAAIDVAPGASIRARIIHASQQSYICPKTLHEYRFTWRTISTWLYRYKKGGITTMDKKTRSDKDTQRKVSLSQLAEAINDVLPTLSTNKVGKLPKSVLYQVLLERNYFTRTQLAPTTFYRLVRDNELLNLETTDKLRMAFAMLHANELWQGDTMYGPAIKQTDGSWKKTYFIAFIDDASRLNDEDLTDFIHQQLTQAKMSTTTFDEGAMTLILRHSEGNLRLCRNLCMGSLIEAARETQKTVTITHVNYVLVQPHWRSHEQLIKQQVPTQEKTA